MPRLLKDLQINDVSSVDRGAGEGVRVLLMKRDSAKPAAKDNVIDMTGLIRPVKKDAIDFEQANENQESREAASSLVQEVNEAICALNDSVCSILCDDTVTNKTASIGESFDQFKAHLEGLAPEDMEKAMTPDEIKKQIDDAVAAVNAPLVAKVAALEDENTFLKMAPAEQEFCKAMTPEQKKAFAAKNAGDKAKQMDEAKKAAEVQIDPAIAKRLAKADEDSILLKALVEKDEIATFAKKATDLGLAAEQGEVLRKAAKDGDIVGIEAVIKQLTGSLDATQRVGKIFAEFGKQGSGPSGATAYDQLVVKAEEFRKTETGSKMTQAQCFEKVLTDPANADLAAQERNERMAKIHGRAA